MLTRSSEKASVPRKACVKVSLATRIFLSSIVNAALLRNEGTNLEETSAVWNLVASAITGRRR